MKENRWIRINRRRNVYEEEGQPNKWENKMAQKEKEGWERQGFHEMAKSFAQNLRYFRANFFCELLRYFGA